MGLDFLLIVGALGVAGFDPFGALLVAAALALGASRGSALAFLLLSAVIPLAVGGIAGHALGPVITRIESWLRLPPSIWAAVSIAAGLGLVGWGVLRVRRGASGQSGRPEHTPRGVSMGAMAGAGLAFGLTALLDPAYYGVVAFVARNPDPIARMAGLVGWFAIAQGLLIALVVGSWLGDAQRAASWLRRVWHSASPVIARSVTVAALMVGSALVVDGVWYLATGSFLVG